ncbi:SDR family NAD(P)-dependent oxidoreductase [Methylobacterium sp. sgz302541]|uniref:SDR family NAD(P)-dependent oxidoreductase n=1 Tax=unclassified Methylobacterium TaxID=2615210 RepID=UPI003D351E63
MAQAFPLRGGVALVTGAAGGIGAALSLALAGRGCALALVDRDAEGLERTRAGAERLGVTVSTHPLDLVEGDAIRALPEAVLARHGRLTLLVNNAGVALGGRFFETDLADFEWVMDVNLRAAVRMTHAFLPALMAEETAQIVNVSSLYGIVAPPGQAAYCASKFGLRGFSESLRHEHAGTGLGVTLVHPGGVATGIARNARLSKTLDPEKAERARKEFEKLLRQSPEDAAAAILRAIERRAPRAIVGRDAKAIALIQRLAPVGYWSVLARLIGQKR